MTFTRLSISGFRIFESIDLHFSPGMNVVVGPNGSGKSSVIEAIYFLGHARSFRSSTLAPMIADEHPGFSLFAELNPPNQGPLKLGLSRYRTQAPEHRIDGQNVPSALGIAQALPVVAFTPETLIMRGAKSRIRLLDWAVFYSAPGFAKAWSQVNALIKQRNAALKQQLDTAVIESYNQSLFPVCEAVDRARNACHEAFLPLFNQQREHLLPDYPVECGYQRGWADGEGLSEIWPRVLNHDRRFGATSFGPHRADYVFKIGHKIADQVLSRGQQKLLMCAFKLAQVDFMLAQSDRTPLVLFDDLPSELDGENRDKVFELIKECKIQSVITSISDEFLVEYGPCNNRKIISLNKGFVEHERDN